MRIDWLKRLLLDQQATGAGFRRVEMGAETAGDVSLSFPILPGQISDPGLRFVPARLGNASCQTEDDILEQQPATDGVPSRNRTAMNRYLEFASSANMA